MQDPQESTRELLLTLNHVTLNKILYDYFHNKCYGNNPCLSELNERIEGILNSAPITSDIVDAIIDFLESAGVVYDSEWQDVKKMINVDLLKYNKDKYYIFDPTQWEYDTYV